MRPRKRDKYIQLRNEKFTPFEARQLSKLTLNIPALKLAREERQARWGRFEKIAAKKIDSGRWSRGQLATKWLKNLSRMYTKHGWRVKEGPKGKQTQMPKGSPNVWALYRDAERRIGGPGSKGQESPWEVKRVNQTRMVLDRGLIQMQKAKREGKSPTRDEILQWIKELNEKIRTANGDRKRQLILQRSNLERRL